MDTQQAMKILTDGRFVAALIDQAIDHLQRTTLDMGDPTVENLIKRKGQLEGLRMAKSFYVEADLVLARAREDANDAQASLTTEMAPPSLVGASIHPKPPTEGA